MIPLILINQFSVVSIFPSYPRTFFRVIQYWGNATQIWLYAAKFGCHTMSVSLCILFVSLPITLFLWYWMEHHRRSKTTRVSFRMLMYVSQRTDKENKRWFLAVWSCRCKNFFWWWEPGSVTPSKVGTPSGVRSRLPIRDLFVCLGRLTSIWNSLMFFFIVQCS